MITVTGEIDMLEQFFFTVRSCMRSVLYLHRENRCILMLDVMVILLSIIMLSKRYEKQQVVMSMRGLRIPHTPWVSVMNIIKSVLRA